jgi:predicted TIM-barrel fold metal-dependent hydrolase
MPKAADLLDDLRRDRPAAVTLRPAEHGYPLDKLYCGELMEVLQELRIPVLLYNNATAVPEFMTRIPTIAKEFPKLPIVVIETTYTTSMFNYVCMKETENILLGIGGMESFGEVDHLVNTFGGHRFVVSSTAGCISAGALGMVYLGRFSQEDKELILGGNWQRLQEEIKWA